MNGPGNMNPDTNPMQGSQPGPRKCEAKKNPALRGFWVLLLIDVIRGLEYLKLACLSGLA